MSFKSHTIMNIQTITSPNTSTLTAPAVLTASTIKVTSITKVNSNIKNSSISMPSFHNIECVFCVKRKEPLLAAQSLLRKHFPYQMVQFVECAHHEIREYDEQTINRINQQHNGVKQPMLFDKCDLRSPY